MVSSNLPSLFTTSLGGLAFAGLPRGRGDSSLIVQPTEDGLSVRAPAPGLVPDSIEVSIEQDRLEVRALARSFEPDLETSDQEARAGFSLRLPFRVDAPRAKASYEQGMLLIDLPRPKADRPHQLEVRTDG